MKNILIDTCSLIDLLSEDHNKLLPHLVFWQQNDCLNFVTHNIIIEEWNKHKEKQRNIFAQSLQIKYSHLHQIRKKEGLLIPERLEPDLHNIDSQIRIVDEILQNSVLLETTDDIKILCSDRTIIKKAPFHNKIDSTKDAYIIFSSLKYFNDKKEDLFFISANKKEFGSPDNLESKIHPEIIQGYTNINVQYESSIGKAINILRSELPISLSPEIINTNLSKTADIEIIIDKSKPILEQVYEYIIQRYKEIKYYPISLLVNHYPFKLNFSYYSLFNLNTDNEELVELFKSVEISQTNEVTINDENFYKGVDNYQNKIKTVLKHLSSNLIFNISLDKPRENIAIRYSTEKDCECPKCCYNKFKFSESFIGLSNYKDTQEELQQSSYINYRIGNYLLAIDKQQQALKKYQKKGLNTLTFISEFNLIKLSNFVRNNYFRENSQDELIDKLNNIDLEFQQTNLSTDENRKLLKYIKENSFYTDARNKIQELSGKLIDQYYSSLNGSWSSNSHVWSLINEFAQLESFIVGNYLIYDKFKEFQDISTIFIEGLFASYGIKDPQHSRLEDFDDWIIKQILIYGDAKIINKYFNRYKLKKIRYKRTSSDKDSFEELIENFFKNENLRESFIENCEEDNHRFWEYYNNIFKNILTLLSICDIEPSVINKITKQLIDFLERETVLNPASYGSINTFLNRCGKNIENELIQSFFNLGIKNRFLHDSEFFYTLSSIVKKREVKIEITPEQFTAIRNISFEECNLCKEKHNDTNSIHLYSMINDTDFLKEIENHISIKLEKDFSFDLFYQATLFDLIPLNNSFLNKAIEFSLPKSDRISFKSVFSGIPDNRFENVECILNLCFKFNIDTTTSEFVNYKKLDPYYDWLVDMENYNYELFDPSWIGRYRTRFYFRQIYNSKMVKKNLDYLIKDKFDSNLERDYINIYVRKTWDVKD